MQNVEEKIAKAFEMAAQGELAKARRMLQALRINIKREIRQNRSILLKHALVRVKLAQKTLKRW
jgi:16S rRNA C1402 N4-methylase RsmH